MLLLKQTNGRAMQALDSLLLPHYCHAEMKNTTMILITIISIIDLERNEKDGRK